MPIRLKDKDRHYIYIVGDIVARAMLFASQRLKSVSMRVDVGDVVIKCAPPLLTQALTNLVENAADAAGPDGWVDLRAAVGGNAVTITVTDSGPGVPQDLRDRVFEPFFTTKPEGMGMGLSISRSIVAAHGGRFRAIPNEPRGAVFQFALPTIASDTSK